MSAVPKINLNNVLLANDPIVYNLSTSTASTSSLLMKSSEQDYVSVLLDSETETAATEQTATTASSVDNTSKNLSLEDTHELFKQDITKEDFVRSFNEMLKNADPESSAGKYLASIASLTPENFFDSLDTNGTGALEQEELSNIANKSNEILPTATENTTAKTANEIETTSDATNDVSQTAETSRGKRNNSKNNSNSTKNPINDSLNTDQQQQLNDGTPADLRKQRQEIIDNADKEIADLDKQINDAISQSETVSAELKQQYNDAKKAYDDNEANIKTNQTKIADYNSQLHSIESSLAAVQGELGNLKTDTGNEEVDSKNRDRKKELEKTKKDLEEEKDKIQKAKEELEAATKLLEESRPGLQEAVDASLQAIQALLSEETKTAINDIKGQIQAVRTKKEIDLKEIDTKIATKEAEEIQSAKNQGTAVGAIADNEFGQRIIETAAKYLGLTSGKKFSTGNYGWCADFVTYVVKEVFKNSGATLQGNHLGASPLKLINRNSEHWTKTKALSEADRLQFAQTQMKPGMLFISSNSKKTLGHVGFVSKVYPDGSFDTIEGNTQGGKCAQNRRNINDVVGIIDLSYLYNV